MLHSETVTEATPASAQRPIGSEREVDFPIGHVLASTTDARGVITSVNRGFCEVSGHDGDALIGAPHRIVRHGDTPRGLFHLYWSILKSGRPTCAYVKNKTADGQGFYWVYSVVIPITEGFLSMRFKPRSKHFEAIREIYADLIVQEKQGATPELSAAVLLERLSENGFDDYQAFVDRTLKDEIGDLCAATAGNGANLVERIGEIKRLTAEIAAIIRTIGAGFHGIRGEPVNMRILAGRLDGAGAAIATISQNYEAMAGEMQQAIESLQSRDSGTLSHMIRSISASYFAALADLLVQQTLDQAALEGRIDDGCQLMSILQEERMGNLLRIRQMITEMIAISKDINAFCRQLRRRINGLDVVKLLCRVENGRLGKADTGLQGIIDRLEHFHGQTDLHLAELSSKAAQIAMAASALR